MNLQPTFLFLTYLSLKPGSAIFYKCFFFTNRWPFKNYEKRFLFHLKSSFHSRDIQFFVVFSFLSTLSRFKRINGSGIFYDVMK